MKIYIGSDHAGVALKSKVLAKVQSMGCDVEDLGPYSEDRVDYPVYGRKVGERVARISRHCDLWQWYWHQHCGQ